MRRLAKGLTFLGVVLALLAATAFPNLGQADESRIGARIGNFSLRDFHGKICALDDYSDARFLVVAFLGTECPLARQYAPRLEALSKEFADKGVAFVGINSNLQDTITEVADHANANGLTFPVLKDPDNTVSDLFGATRTPEVFLLDQDRVVRYHGRIDDQFGIGFQREKPTRRDLAVALEELLAGKPVSEPEMAAVGCIIGRIQRTEPHGDITYSTHIAGIMNKHCVECHRKGELAPFPLTSYDEVLGWAETIQEVIGEGRMPPWFADPKHGVFSNDPSMTVEERQLIATWVANGSPQGDLDQLPAPPHFTSGWRIGEPDAVYHMEESYTVPAEGVIEYEHFTIDPGLTEDVWITDAEARPGNPAVVHHIVLFAAPKGGSLRGRGPTQSFGQMIAIYAPGMPPWQYPQGTAMKVSANSVFVIQMHYTPTGKVEEDRSMVGLKFAKEQDVKKKIRYGMALNAGFEIPPNAEDHVISSQTKFTRDTLLLHLFPHMHYRGKAFRFEAQYPDGTKEVLLDVPRYDFNWQLRYDLAEPKLLPKGTRLVCTGHFDNSANNLRNPNPNETVRFGLQSWEEMMVGYYTTVAAEEDLTASEEHESEGGE